ncbi:predicted protein [Plenodomus lingam JN3]|uniref:Predicted protein n=1 Tax=Leptosphaeria maculans (strain JN3 / isolate v23.1.3 / race Av1-4-5-6-7-8) TaxID=985895 RepID=E4ZM48_LEPMJ|nr:predicted protein [Plenodomus lingam JN3]CBX92397.1 predicted protein [Plenodomus lingam JN3]
MYRYSTEGTYNGYGAIGCQPKYPIAILLTTVTPPRISTAKPYSDEQTQVRRAASDRPVQSLGAELAAHRVLYGMLPLAPESRVNK